MTGSSALWWLLALNAGLYAFAGRFIVSRGALDRPLILLNPAVAYVVVGLPLVGFVVLIAAGFVWHQSPWWFLVANIAVFVAFSVKPTSGL